MYIPVITEEFVKPFNKKIVEPIKKCLFGSNYLPPIEEALGISKDYQSVVEYCNRNKVNRFIKNPDVSHATFLIYNLIKRTKRNGQIKIFSGTLDKAVYESPYIKQALIDALKRKVTIKIILEKGVGKGDKNNNPIKELLKHKTVDLKKLKIPVQSPSHFLISDHNAARIELPHEEGVFDSDNIQAKVNFNNKCLVNSVENKFDDYFLNNSESIKL